MGLLNLRILRCEGSMVETILTYIGILYNKEFVRKRFTVYKYVRERHQRHKISGNISANILTKCSSKTPIWRKNEIKNFSRQKLIQVTQDTVIWEDAGPFEFTLKNANVIPIQ